MSLNFLTMSQLEDSGERGSVWLLNNLQKSYVNLPGEILINVPTPQGKPDIMKVPQSWLPYEATARFPKKRILESTEFRSAVINELVKIIPEEDAHRILGEEGATEERDRMRALEAHIRQAGAPRKISDANVEIVNPNTLDKGNTTPVDVISSREESVAAQIKGGLQPDAKTGLKPNFMVFFTKIKTQEDISALNALKNKGRFSRRELRYLRDNLPNHPKTIKTIKSRLVELKKASAVSE